MSLTKKLNKLKRDPIKFFNDSRWMKSLKKSESTVEKKPIKKQSKIDPRVLLKLSCDNGLVTVTDLNRKVIDKNISSIFLTRKFSNYNNAPILNAIRKYQSSVYREKVHFYGECSEAIFTDDIDLRKCINDKVWRNNPLFAVSNVFLIDPPENLVRLILHTHCYIRVHVIISQSYAPKNGFEADTIFVHYKNSDRDYNVRNMIPYTDTKNLIRQIEEVLMINNTKNHNLLIPITKHCDKIEEIEKINKKNFDVYIKLATGFDKRKLGGTMESIIRMVTDSSEYILARDSVCNQYKYLLEEDPYEFVSKSVKDGLRVEIV